MLKRTVLQHQDEYLTLLELRNTPRQDVRKSPAEIMFGRVTRSLLPTLPKPCHKIYLNRRCKRQIAIKYYDKRARSLQPLCVGDRIIFQSPNMEGWQKGQIVRKLGARTYIIRSSLGVLYKHNCVHIRPDHASTCDVVFNPNYTSTCDVVPSPSSHTSVVASQIAPPAVNDTVAHARPPQFCRPPERLRDYVCY